jgi:molybdate transport system substrate-binding protein
MIGSRRATFLALASMVAIAPTLSPAQASQVRPKAVIIVFAASSLSDTFSQIGENFRKKNPYISIKFSFLASSVLASQIAAGAPADVFAAASPRDMADAGRSVMQSKVFASNRIVLAFPRRNSNLVSSFKDLNKSKVKWIQCAPSVACGSATSFALSKLGEVTSKPVSYEPKAASVVSKLLDREVDAAFIYHTDFVANRGQLHEVAFPTGINSSTQYLIALVAESNHKVEAQKFIKEVTSRTGREIMAAAGFGKS